MSMSGVRTMLTRVLTSNRKRLSPLEQALREKTRWSAKAPAPILRPRTYRGRDFMLAGRAFDLWLRGYLGVKYHVTEGTTVNEMVLQDRSWWPYLDEATVTYDDGRVISMRSGLASTVQVRRDAIRRGQIDSEDFFENCIDNAMAEGLYRSGDMTNASSHPDPMIADLRALAGAAMARDALFAGTEVNLNPAFPHPTIAADGDFAIDACLVDIKTTKELIPPLAFTQVASYALLEAWCRGCHVECLRYHRAAIYSARYAALGVVDLRHVSGVLAPLRAFLEEAAERHEAQQSSATA